MADPADQHNVKLLLHLDGSNGSTTFTDSSLSVKSASAVNGAAISTAQSKFSGASAFFDGNVDAITVPVDSDFQFGGGDFTIEFWFRVGSLPGTQQLYTDTDGTYYQILIYIDFSNNVVGIAKDVTHTTKATPSSGGTVAINTWYHIAFVRYGSVLKLFKDGTQTGADKAITTDLWTTAGNPTIGNYYPGGTGNGTHGYIDDFRLTKGEAIYTANFTPPTSAHTDPPPPVVYDSYVACPGPLGSVEVLGAVLVSSQAVADGPLGSAQVLARSVPAAMVAVAGPLSTIPLALAVHDFSAVVGTVSLYVLDVIDVDDVATRVPISSWQATQQVGRSNYLQVVIPAATLWVDAINAAVSFTVYRRAVLDDGFVFEYAMASSVVTEARFDTGPYRSTCTISGYEAGIVDPGTPSTVFDRTLTGIRSTSSGSSGLRVRCAIDWLLRPGQRAYVEGSPIIVRYMNLYATGTDAYMDVGELAS